MTAQALLLILGALVLAFGLAVFVGRRTKEEETSRITDAVTYLWTVFLLVLALAVVLGHDGINRAEDNAEAEADSLVELYWTVSALPEPDRARLQSAIRRYTNQALKQEWRVMATGNVSPQVGDSLTAIRADLYRLRSPNENTETLRQEALGKVEETIENRRSRVDDATSRMPAWLLIGLVVTGIGTIVLPFFAWRELSLGNVVGDATRAIIAAAGIVVVFSMAQPYSGPWAVTPEPFTGALKQYDKINEMRLAPQQAMP